MNTEVTLISKTEDIFRTIWMVWQASRKDASTESINDSFDEVPADVLTDLFRSILAEDIPLMEMIDFVFVLDNVSISLREQLVRHRVGTKLDGKIGVDIIPELGDSTWWSQSMRILDMQQFARLQQYHIPDSIHEGTIVSRQNNALSLYREHMNNSAAVYSELVDAGVPMEDARNVLPLAVSHRIVWKLNLSTLKRILSKRGCWILQLGIWKHLIQGIVEELSERVHPTLFRDLITPPCIGKDDKFKGCKFCENNKERIAGIDDEIPPCSLYLNYHHEEAVAEAAKQRMDAQEDDLELVHWHVTGPLGKLVWKNHDPEKSIRMAVMQEAYESLWGRNPITGARNAAK
jgi:thymidylate synthase ThyX